MIRILTFRLIATIIPQTYSRVGSVPGVVLSIVVVREAYCVLITLSLQVASSIAAPLIIAIGDPYDDIVPNCFFFPQHSAPKANVFLVVLSVLVIMSILFNFIIICVNKKLEKKWVLINY